MEEFDPKRIIASPLRIFIRIKNFLNRYPWIYAIMILFLLFLIITERFFPETYNATVKLGEYIWAKIRVFVKQNFGG